MPETRVRSPVTTHLLTSPNLPVSSLAPDSNWNPSSCQTLVDKSERRCAKLFEHELTVTVTASWIGRPLWILRNVTPFKVRQVIFDKVWSQFFFLLLLSTFFQNGFWNLFEVVSQTPGKAKNYLGFFYSNNKLENKKVILVFSWPTRSKNFGTRASNNVRPLHFSRGFSPPSISPDCAFSLFLVSFFFLRINAGGRHIFTKRF